MNNLDWYLLEHSYLMDIQVSPVSGILTLCIDAKMTYDHPNIHENTKTEEGFMEIEIIFKGVQYLRMLNSSLLFENPNDDIGSIELFSIKDIDTVRRLSNLEINNNQESFFDLSDGNAARVLLKNERLKYLNFLSEFVSFELGFEELSIIEK
ncbi:hypothetical protein R3398_18710 [Rossellomorea marisflavi]|uniref:hypothetical protein n=1 Tax=Rossellomorea marisflavi TaxID=189381 RepID=UPI0006FDD1D1|nr:hypothetical protein [Rossellomorea marisflavi]KQU58352.1 hypothetical protein ASG66_15050 [Bacillus sp. Leaf406]MDW4528375.1 hypothetical protein [Rossellomorea marisflavi]